MMTSQRAFIALILFLTSSGIGHGQLAPPDITGLKVAKGGFDIDLDDSRSYVVDDRQGVVSKIWCIVEGEISEVSWYFNEEQSKPIAESAIYHIGEDEIGYYLEILNVNKSIEGHYHCEAENIRGRALSQYVNVTVAFIGTYGKVANRVEIKEYREYLMLHCQPLESNPSLSISWKNEDTTIVMNERVQMDPTGNLYISDLVESDAGTYKCFVKNPVLGQTFYSEEISIGFGENPTEVAKRGPVLVYNPEDTTIGMRTTNLKLQCIAQGNPTPSIRWEKVGGTIKSSTVDKSVLEISGVDFTDAGIYRCTAQNSEDSVTVETNVIIEASPYAGVVMVNKQVFPGETAEFTCDPKGEPSPTFQWLINGKPPKNEKYNVDGKNVTIPDADANGSAVFQCVIDNVHGIYIDQATYQVVYVVPDVTKGPTNIRVVEGKDVNFTCEYIGKPEPTVTWKFKTSKIEAGSKYAINSGDGNSTLTISNVSITDDAGTYECSVENGFGNDEDSGALIVLQKTVITQKPAPQTNVSAGNPVMLNCQANTYIDAPLAITWEDDEGKQVAQGNQFSIQSSKLEESGVYTCVATTDLDEDRASAAITVQDRPGPLTRVYAVLDSGNENRVSIEWDAGPAHNSPITGFIIEAKTAYDSQWSETWDAESDQISTKVDVYPGNTYEFRMAAVNKIGTSEFVESSSVVDTPAGPPRVNPTNVTGSGTTTDTMTIKWDKMEQCQHGGEGFKYVVMWRRTGEDKWMNVTIDDYETTEYLVKGTTTYESFDIKVIAVNDEGKGPEDEVMVVGHAGEAKPGAAPTDVVVTPSPTSIRVNWTAIPKDQENGKILQTMIYAKSGSTYESSGCPVEPTSCVVSNLKPNTDYEVYVSVENSKGQGPQSSLVSTTTPEGAPGKVTKFVVNVLSDAMKLTWRDPLETNGVVRGFTIEYGKINAQVEGEEKKINVDADTYEHIVQHLDPGERYSIKIYAFTNAAPGVVTKREESLRPKGEPIAVKKDFIHTNTINNEINLKWETSQEGPAATKFVIRYKKKGESDKTSKSLEISAFEDPLEVDLLELDQGTSYEVIIVAINDEGETPSNSIIVKTSGVASSTGPSATIQAWLIAVICIILLVVLILLLLCFIRSQKGGKYNVSDKEDALRQLDLEAAPLKDQNGFNEYSPTDDSCEEKDPLKNLESAGNEESDSDSDSLADYADGNADQFNEDGSFINEYGDNRRRPHDKESSNAAYNTFV